MLPKERSAYVALGMFAAAQMTLGKAPRQNPTSSESHTWFLWDSVACRAPRAVFETSSPRGHCRRRAHQLSTQSNL